MNPDVNLVYVILRAWAESRRSVRSYTDLSTSYRDAAGGVWFEPHGSWDHPLGSMNRRLATIGAPALSALVTLQSTNEPGGQFWGSAPNVPPRPKTNQACTAEWVRIVQSIEAFRGRWPPALPPAP